MQKDQLEKAEAGHISLMLDATPMAVSFWDAQGTMLDCNQEALRMFGLKEKSDYTEHFFDLNPEFQPDGEATQKKAARLIKAALKIGHQRFEWLYLTGAGEPLPVETTLVRVPWGDGYRITAYSRDLREIKAKEKIAREAEEQIWEQNLRLEEQNARLEELKKTAEEASEAKTRFLATMSHEMRTPLNAIIGLSELGLGSDELTGNAYSSMEKIYVSGMTLLGIINDILDISKIESGKFIMVPAEYETPSFINDTIIQNIIRIGSRPVQFKLHVDENLPFRLFGDELRVKQIFNNLLSNAFKYTEKGTVDWHISCETSGDSVWIVSSIRDTGIGIRREDIPKLFTDYNQVDVKNRRRIEGTGLGLSITKKLVELMDGSITVESEYGTGSVFSLRIKQGYVNGSSIGAEIAGNLSNLNYTAARRSKNEKLHRSWLPYASVLVVDDVPMNLDVAKGMLKPYGMTVDCVESGFKAIDSIREGKINYSAIFMDHMMPEMDGFEAVRIIREEIGTEYAKTIPIIALTANALAGNEDLFLKNGFQAFLSKPIDIIQLDMIVNRYVRNKDLEKKPSVLAGRSMEGIDFDSGLKRFDGNEETYLRILSSYFAQIQNIAEKIQSCTPLCAGNSAIGDYRIIVHNLKSTSYTIGARHIGSMAEELERAVVAGDINYIDTHNGALIESLGKLIPVLKDFLDGAQNTSQKPLRAAPDPVLLARLLKASTEYNMEQMDAAMTELEQYRYTSQADLITWLREEFDKSELESIRERLERLPL